MSKLSMRQIAKELEISPAYLSYMVNWKQPWRKTVACEILGSSWSFRSSLSRLHLPWRSALCCSAFDRWKVCQCTRPVLVVVCAQP